MAGVTPQQRGGSGATTIGMVIAIFVACVLLIALIWLFTMQEGFRQNAKKALDRRTDLFVVAMSRPPGSSSRIRGGAARRLSVV